MHANLMLGDAGCLQEPKAAVTNNYRHLHEFRDGAWLAWWPSDLLKAPHTEMTLRVSGAGPLSRPLSGRSHHRIAQQVSASLSASATALRFFCCQYIMLPSWIS